MSNCIHMSSDVFSGRVSGRVSFRFKPSRITERTSSVQHENDILSECLAAPQTPHQDNQDSVQFLGVLRMGSIMGIDVNIGGRA